MDQHSAGRQGPEPAWARECGFVTLDASPVPDQQGAVDRQAILDTVARYHWCVDERDTSTLASLFTEDSELTGSIAGAVALGPVRGRDAVQEWIRSLPAWSVQGAQRRHCSFNPVVTRYDGKTSEVASYLLLVSTGAAGTQLLTTGFTRFSLARQTDGRWLIYGYFVGLDAVVPDPVAPAGNGERA